MSSNTVSQITEIGNYFNNKKHGEWFIIKMRSKKETSPIQVLNYKNGVLDGKCIEYYLSGKERGICHYKNGIKDGESLLYYPNGNIEVKSFYRRNKPIEWHKFDPEGNPVNSKPIT